MVIDLFEYPWYLVNLQREIGIPLKRERQSFAAISWNSMLFCQPADENGTRRCFGARSKKPRGLERFTISAWMQEPSLVESESG